MNKAPYNPRKIAIQILKDVFLNGSNLSISMDKNQKIIDSLKDDDKRFIFNIVLTTIRRLGHIDKIINNFLIHPLTEKNIDVTNILRIGIAQILFLNVPNHAAVDQSVKLAEGSLIRYKSLINAILRKIINNSSIINSVINNYLENLPKTLQEKWINSYGKDKTILMAKILINEPYLDLTTKKITKDYPKKIEGNLLPNGSIRLYKKKTISTLPDYDKGIWWIQDAGATLPAKLLINSIKKYKKSNNVVEICAAPGGKTAQLCEASLNVTAIDNNSRRMDILKNNLKRLNFNAKYIITDATKWQSDSPVSNILLDAPCSGTGTIRRRPDIAWKVTKNLNLLIELQEKLFKQAYTNLVNGGILVYSVCSIEKEEGIDLVKKMQKIYDLDVLKIQSKEVPGLENAVSREGFLQTLPCFWEKLGGIDGFFVARFIKTK